MTNATQAKLERKVFDILSDHSIIATRHADGKYSAKDKRIAWCAGRDRGTFRSLVAMVDYFKPILLDDKLTAMYN